MFEALPPGESWTPAQAQAHLPDILRLVETQGPQRIRTEESVITLTASPLRVRTAADPEGLTLAVSGQIYAARLPAAGNSG